MYVKRNVRAQCLKIKEKVLFNIASIASYVYILTRQKFINNTKNGELKIEPNSVTRQFNINRTKIGGKCQNSKLQMRHFGWYSKDV